MSDSIHILVRGVILAGDNVLLARAKGAANTFLPGGHVEVGESLSQALIREVAEELGCECRVTDYLGVVEHQWREGGRRQHELNHVFSAALPGITAPLGVVSREAHLEFLWVRPSDLGGHNLLPAPLIDLIRRHGQGNREPFWVRTFPV